MTIHEIYLEKPFYTDRSGLGLTQTTSRQVYLNRFYFIISLSICLIQLLGCNKSKQFTYNIEQYYNLIDTARVYRYEKNDLERAQFYYFESIKYYDPFLSDLEEIFIFLLELKVKDCNAIMSVADILAYKGVPITYFKKCQSKYNIGCNIIPLINETKVYDSEIRDNVIELRNIDIATNRMIHSNTLQEGDRTRILDSLKNAVLIFIEQNNLPKEEEYGVFMNEDSTINYSKIRAPFLHLYMNNLYVFKDSLDYWLESGRIHKSDFRNLTQFISRKNTLNNAMIQEVIRKVKKSKNENLTGKDSIAFIKLKEK